MQFTLILVASCHLKINVCSEGYGSRAFLDTYLDRLFAANYYAPVSSLSGRKDRAGRMPVITQTSVKEHQARMREDGTFADAYLWDDELTGFGCKATPGGKRAFFVQYRPRGGGQNIKRVHIGYYGKLNGGASAHRSQEAIRGSQRGPRSPRSREREAGGGKSREEAAEAEKAAGKRDAQGQDRALSDGA